MMLINCLSLTDDKWRYSFSYENQWVHTHVYFNHLLLQAAICPAANPADENDRQEQQYPISSPHIGIDWIDYLIESARLTK